MAAWHGRVSLLLIDQHPVLTISILYQLPGKPLSPAEKRDGPAPGHKVGDDLQGFPELHLVESPLYLHRGIRANLAAHIHLSVHIAPLGRRTVR